MPNKSTSLVEFLRNSWSSLLQVTETKMLFSLSVIHLYLRKIQFLQIVQFRKQRKTSVMIRYHSLFNILSHFHGKNTSASRFFEQKYEMITLCQNDIHRADFTLSVSVWLVRVVLLENVHRIQEF